MLHAHATSLNASFRVAWGDIGHQILAVAKVAELLLCGDRLVQNWLSNQPQPWDNDRSSTSPWIKRATEEIPPLRC